MVLDGIITAELLFIKTVTVSAFDKLQPELGEKWFCNQTSWALVIEVSVVKKINKNKYRLNIEYKC
ncbi:hypothetical protein D3C71_810360 [compost metagenome]